MLRMNGSQTFARLVGKNAGELIAERFSAQKHAAILEYFDNLPLPANWTVADSVAIWYCLGHLCMMASFYTLEKEIPIKAATALLDSGLHGLLTTWNMSEAERSRFARFNNTKLESAWRLWLSIIPTLADGQEMRKFALAAKENKECLPEVVSNTPVLTKLYTFFGLFVSESFGGDVSFTTAVADGLLSQVRMSEPVFPLLRTISYWFLGTQNRCIEFVRPHCSRIAED